MCKLSISEIKKEITDLAYGESKFQIFSDLVFFMGAFYRNALTKFGKGCEKIEKEYIQRINVYEEKQRNKFSEIVGMIISLADNEGIPRDILGEIFMELELGNKSNGQFFTPDTISYLMANLNLVNYKRQMSDKGLIEINDPACGSGSTLLASVRRLIELKVNVNRDLLIVGNDLDRMVAIMCFAQLSMWHIPCKIFVGDTLKNQFTECWCSPAYFLSSSIPKVEKMEKGTNNFILVGEVY